MTDPVNTVVDRVIGLVKWAVNAAEAIWFFMRAYVKRMVEIDVLFLASGLAFNGLLTLVPLLLLGAAALGTFLNDNDAAMRQVAQILDAVFPAQPYSTNIKDSISTVVADIISYRTSLGVIGILVLFWTASALFEGLRVVLHRIYRIEPTRGIIKSLLHDLLFVFLAFVLFVGSSVTLWVGSIMENLSDRVPALDVINVPEFSTVPLVLMTAVMFYVIHRYIPDSKPPKKPALLATVTTTLLWVVSGELFALYLRNFSAIGEIYGSYAFLLVLLVWVYYSALVFILGGLAGQAAWERRRMLRGEPPTLDMHAPIRKRRKKKPTTGKTP